MGLNRVAVGDVSRTITQGSSCLATLGSGTESRWDSRTERDSASRSRFANTEMVGCFRRNIACGSAAGRGHVERRKSKDHKVPIGTTESIPRFQPWVAIEEWPEPRRGDRKDGTGPVRSFVPDGTRFMFAPQPSDKSLGYFRASLPDVESRHAKHVRSPRLPSRSRSATAASARRRPSAGTPASRRPASLPYLSATASNATRQHSANAARDFSCGTLRSLAARMGANAGANNPHLVGRGQATVEIEDDRFGQWPLAVGVRGLVA